MTTISLGLPDPNTGQMRRVTVQFYYTPYTPPCYAEHMLCDAEPEVCEIYHVTWQDTRQEIPDPLFNEFFTAIRDHIRSEYTATRRRRHQQEA